MKRALLGGIVVAWLLAAAAPAGAHALLRSSDPASGDVLQRSPASLSLAFTEEPDPTLSTIRLLDATGATVDVGSPAAAADPHTLVVSVTTPLPDGAYTVAWQTISKVDGHLAAGAFAFGIGRAAGKPVAPAGGAAASTPRPTPLSVAGKTLLYLGLALLMGAGVVSTWVLGIGPHRLLLAGGAALTLAGSVAILVAERGVVGVSYAALLRSPAGRPFGMLALAGIVTAALGVAAVLHPTRPWIFLAGAGTVAIELVRADGGHAAGASTAWVQVGLQWLHIVAATAWMGGLAMLVIALVSRRGEPHLDMVRRFSRFALPAIAAVAVTGAFRAVNELGGPREVLHVLDTGYGTTLVWKSGLALAAIALGGLNRYRSLPRLAAGGSARLLRSLAGGEVTLAAGVFALTGLLTGLPPGTSAAGGPPPAQKIIDLRGHDFATTINVELRIDPGTAGTNSFTARITDFDTGRAVKADRVSIDLRPVGRPGVSGSTVELAQRGDTWKTTSSQLSITGIWRATAQIQTGSSVAQVAFSLALPPPGQQISVSSAPGQPDIVTIGLNDAQLQSYLDPGDPGPNELHLTAFGAGGNELPLRTAAFTAAGPGGAVATFDPRRLSAGHFVADSTLDPGPWTFFFDLQARDGRHLQGSFAQTIPGTTG